MSESARPPSAISLFEQVRAAFDSEGWAHEPIGGRDGEVLRARFEAQHTRVDLHVQVFDPIRAVSVVAEAPLTTRDPARRERLAELAMRSNESLTVGAFEMLWDRGLLMFRVTNLFSESGIDRAIVVGMVHATIAEMDRLAPVLAALFRAQGADLAGLDLVALLQREDWLPGGGLKEAGENGGAPAAP